MYNANNPNIDNNSNNMNGPPFQQQSTTGFQEMNNYIPASQIGQISEAVHSLTRILTEIGNYLVNLRREFRGEAMYQDENGDSHWIQVSKPTFVKVDHKTHLPLKQIQKMPWGEEKEIYIANDQAIDEVLSMLKFMGINQVQPVGTNTEDNYLDDLREFECKLAAVLCLKQKDWGMDKEMLPMEQSKIKTLIQDARSLSLRGATLKALQTTVQRVEQLVEGEKSRRKDMNPYH